MHHVHHLSCSAVVILSIAGCALSAEVEPDNAAGSAQTAPRVLFVLSRRDVDEATIQSQRIADALGWSSDTTIVADPQTLLNFLESKVNEARDATANGAEVTPRYDHIVWFTHHGLDGPVFHDGSQIGHSWPEPGSGRDPAQAALYFWSLMHYLVIPGGTIWLAGCDAAAPGSGMHVDDSVRLQPYVAYASCASGRRVVGPEVPVAYAEHAREIIADGLGGDDVFRAVDHCAARERFAGVFECPSFADTPCE
jgi:hypothetical protein